MHLLYVVEGVMQPTLYEESGSSGAHTPSRLPTTACLRCREQELKFGREHPTCNWCGRLNATRIYRYPDCPNRRGPRAKLKSATCAGYSSFTRLIISVKKRYSSTSRSMSINRLFNSNDTFGYEALRAAGYSNYGGADLAEVAAISSKIRPGNEDDWVREWQRAAERASSQAERSKSVNNIESARQGYLRASNYFRTAEFFRRENVDEDELAQFLYQSSETSFEKAMALSSFIYEAVTIPYEGTALPGYFVSVDNTKKPRRTIIFNGGYDSTMSEGWFAIGAAALARGYNFLAFDGPGQGAAVRRQHLYFRPDWEHVLSPVVDYALTREDVDANAMAIFGWSMGGYLVARGATQEHRARAIILDDGVFDFGSAFRAQQPSFVQKLVELKYDSICNWIFGRVASLSTGIRWALLNGQWTFGLQSVSDLMRATTEYTLEGLSQKIVTPCLILDAENDHFLKGQPEVFRASLHCEHEFVSLRAGEGADTHCHQGAFFRTHQVIFDYLATRLGSDIEA